jgi:peptidylprolyl isomerase/peptidyl-prolyl cis-trans isomerase B (cyclophilin B)
MKTFIKHISITLIIVLFASASAPKPALKEDYVVTITTKFGDMVLLLHEQTPKHKENFIKLSQEGFYNGTTFHRVIKNFMIQGGDPNSKDSIPRNDGQGGPGYTIPAEFRPELKHDKGSLAAARQGDQVNPTKASSGSQFYIVNDQKGAHFLDGSYTVFGHVIQGMSVIDKISAVTTDPLDRPLEDVVMQVKVVKMKTSKIIKTYDCAWFYDIK